MEQIELNLVWPNYACVVSERRSVTFLCVSCVWRPYAGEPGSSRRLEGQQSPAGGPAQLEAPAEGPGYTPGDRPPPPSEHVGEPKTETSKDGFFLARWKFPRLLYVLYLIDTKEEAETSTLSEISYLRIDIFFLNLWKPLLKHIASC